MKQRWVILGHHSEWHAMRCSECEFGCDPLQILVGQTMQCSSTGRTKRNDTARLQEHESRSSQFDLIKIPTHKAQHQPLHGVEASSKSASPPPALGQGIVYIWPINAQFYLTSDVVTTFSPVGAEV